MNDQRPVTDQLRDAVTVPRGALERVLRMAAVDMHNPCRHDWKCEVGDSVERLRAALDSAGQWYVQYRYAEGMAPHVFRTHSLEGARQILASVPAEIMETNVPPACDPATPATHCGASDCTDHGCQEA